MSDIVVKIFTHKNFGKVEVIRLNDEVLFNANDVAKILGIVKVRNTVVDWGTKYRRILTNSDAHSVSIRKFNNKGETFLTEAGLYKLIFKSRKPEAEKFQDWVFTEVLPTIRKTGGYVMQGRALDFVNLWLPQLDETSRKAIANVLEENMVLRNKVKEMEPKVEFADMILKSDVNIHIGDFVKIISSEYFPIGRNRFFQLLREKKYLDKNNVPYQQYIDSGYFVVKESVIKHNSGKKEIKAVPLLTPRGQKYFTKKYLEWFNFNIKEEKDEN